MKKITADRAVITNYNFSSQSGAKEEMRITWSHMRPSSGTRASFLLVANECPTTLLRHGLPVTVGKSLKLPEIVALLQKGTVI